MAIQGLQVTVGTTATLLSATSAFTDSVAYNQNGQSLLVQNPSTTVTVYLGGSNVTSSIYGYSLAPGATMSIDLSQSENLYAAVASGTQSVNVLRKGV